MVILTLVMLNLFMHYTPPHFLSCSISVVRPDFFYKLIYGNFFSRFRVWGTGEKRKKGLKMPS